MNQTSKLNCLPRLALAAGLLALAAADARSDDALAALEERAIQRAVARVAPSVVRIETVGGLARGDAAQAAGGTTTGLVVGSEGWILTSSFGFAAQPGTILVILPSGTRLPARRAATDYSRNLVLLKIETGEPLSVAEAAPDDSLAVGQWSLAVGRTFETSAPNVSVGLLSATGRIFGKALQTDARVSPSNYGGPLVDIQGRVMGVLVPLSPGAGGDAAGLEWYDSGIGFAVPMAQIRTILPRLSAGEDLHPGLTGIALEERDPLGQTPQIAAVRVNSPAAKAGLKPGDRLLAVDGIELARNWQFENLVRGRYAGQNLKLAVQRAGDDAARLEVDLELVATIDPYRRPYLGLVLDPAERTQPADGQGVAIVEVAPDSPAARAGLRAGDRLVALDGVNIASRDAALERLRQYAVGDPLRVASRRGAAVRDAAIVLAPWADALPASWPKRPAAPLEGPPQRETVGQVSLKIPEFPHECLAYLPSGYDDRIAWPLLVWLHGPGGYRDDELLAHWQAHCDREGVILLAPRAADPARWLPGEAAMVAKAIEALADRFQVDRQRITLAGARSGGTLGSLVAFTRRDLVRGLVLIEAPLAIPPPEHDPLYRLAIISYSARGSQGAARIAQMEKRLRALEYPLLALDLGQDARELSGEETRQMLGWVVIRDML